MLDMVSSRLNGQHAARTLQFVPFPEQENRRFNLVLRDDSLWLLFEYLSRHGVVKIRGRDFQKMKPIRNYLTTGQLSVKLEGIPAKYAAAELSFLTGMPMRVKAKDANKTVSISVQNATIDEILSQVLRGSGVTIRRLNVKRTRK
jgi:hypothetical protein